MANIKVHEILAVDKDRLFQFAVGYEEYPLFVPGVKSVQVERKGMNRARVTYQVSIIKNVFYTLDLVESANTGTIEWNLVKSNFFRINHGCWRMKELGPKCCEMWYELEYELKIPMPAFILNRLLKQRLLTLMKNFEKRV